MKMKTLVGSGDKIALFTLPFLVAGLALNAYLPGLFDIGQPSQGLRAIFLVALAAGVTVWLWSAVLILTKVSRHELITRGPFALVKHPLYTGVGLLVVPSIGLLLGSWLGIVVGLAIYTGCRLFSVEEEKALSETFGRSWDEYCDKVALPWV